MDRFSAEAQTWDEQPGKVERARAAAEAVAAALDLDSDPGPGPGTGATAGVTAIEVGGGTGLLSRFLAERVGPMTVTVTDVAPGMVEAARAVLDDPRYEGWRAARLDVEHDPLPEQRYDLVLSMLALHHMGDVEAVFPRLLDLLVPGGAVALLDLDEDPDGAFHAHVDDFDGHHGFGHETIRGWLTSAGFVDVSVTLGPIEHKTVNGVDREFPLFLATARRPVDNG